MSLKPYDQLTEGQKKQVALMYTDKSTVGNYLYNFDEQGAYHGRQFAPPVGVIRADPVEPNEAGKKMLEKPEVKTETFQDVEKYLDPKLETPRRTRRTAKK